MAKGLLFASFDTSPAQEDEFNDWYDLEHVPERLRVPGFLNGQRWIGEDNPKYGSFLTAVFDALRNMTKAALARAAELRAERAAAKAAKPKADKPADEPKTP